MSVEEARRRRRRDRLGAAGGIMVALSAAAGLLVGVRSVVAVELPGVHALLRLPALPRESMGIAWTRRVVWPDQIQAAALDRVGGLIAALLLAATSVALLNALVLLLEAGSSRRREIAVRAAVGAGPRALVGLLLRDVRRLVATALALGVLLGIAGGGALRAAWPGVTEGVDLTATAASIAPALLLLAALAAGIYVRTGLVVGRTMPLAGLLSAGGRATPGRGETFVRRALSAVQMGVAGAVAIGTLALVGGHPTPPPLGPVADEVVVVGVQAPSGGDGATWTHLLTRLAAVPGLQAESLSTPGALVGLGVRDYATAQCGACFRGGLPMPFWGARADHHAVGPGFFEAAGMRITSGREFTADDARGGKPVAVVNRTFASASFENGDPLGHLVRLGAGMHDWYEVVGVVEDVDTPVVGGDDLARPAVWVNALQRRMERGDVLLRGSDAAVRDATALLRAAGYAPGQPRTISRERRRAAAPLLWAGRLAALLGLLTLGLAVHGGHATALQIGRRRTREVALRRALGATDRGLLVHTLAGSARTALWGGAFAVFFGSLLVALLRQAVGGVPALGPGAYAAVFGLLTVSALLASVRAVREALAVEPAGVLDQEAPVRGATFHGPRARVSRRVS
jgi:putative ABC transport system permease protein